MKLQQTLKGQHVAFSSLIYKNHYGYYNMHWSNITKEMLAIYSKKKREMVAIEFSCEDQKSGERMAIYRF